MSSHITITENGEQLDVARENLPAISTMVYEFEPGMYHIAEGFSWADIEGALPNEGACA